VDGTLTLYYLARSLHADFKYVLAFLNLFPAAKTYHLGLYREKVISLKLTSQPFLLENTKFISNPYKNKSIDYITARGVLQQAAVSVYSGPRVCYRPHDCNGRNGDCGREYVEGM
jgi:hypothetical protein